MDVRNSSLRRKRNSFRDYSAESSLFLRRALIAFATVLLLFSLLVVNLYHLQVTRFEDYQTRSNNNRIKLVPIPPSRGLIYDRNGNELALNRTIYQLELVPEKVPGDLKATFNELRSIIDLTDDDIANFEKERANTRRFNFISLKTALTEEQIARFSINQYRFPAFEIKGYQRRYYPYGSAVTHTLGYVSKINDRDIKWLNDEGRLKDYSATNDIGKQGIERYYEKLLHGKPGYAEVEVNNTGRVIRQLSEQPPQAGQDIYLTLDINLQIYIEKLLDGRRAAVVVSDPRDGSILALVSSPTYDANLFVNGISNKDYSALRDDPNRPLFNRATQGTYPPASTVKPFIAVAALANEIVTKESTIVDPGWWRLPNTKNKGPCTTQDKNQGCYRDWSWRRGGQGVVNITRAIELSSDTYFYQIAFDLGIDRLAKWMKSFGYGEYTDIDLFEESRGLMPTREWKQKRHKQAWYQGDTISVGIGQGYWIATPLQMMKALTTVINNGTVKTPHLLMDSRINNQKIPYQDKTNQQLGDKDATYWQTAKFGMYQVMHGKKGSAQKSFANTEYNAAGKSGTAQVFGLNKQIYKADELPEHLRDHALFTAYAPYDNPTVAITLVVENALKGGSSTAAPIVRQILDYVLVEQQAENISTTSMVVDEGDDLDEIDDRLLEVNHD